MPCKHHNSVFVPKDWGDFNNEPRDAYYKCKDCGFEDFEDAEQVQREVEADFMYEQERERRL